MKKVLIFCVLASVLVLMAGPVVADPNLYFDFDNDGVYDTSWVICGKTSVEIYLDDWDTSSFPSEPLFGVQMFFYYDETKVKVNMENSYPNDTIHGGPFEPTLSLPQDLGGGKIKLVATHELGCEDITDHILLWTLELEGIAAGSSDISIRVDLNSVPVHGAVFPGGENCSGPHQADAGNGVATISVPDGTDGDGDGLADECDNCPNTPNGQDLGTCVNCNDGSIGSTCTANEQCTNGYCSMEQEDYDRDNIGNVCDDDIAEDIYPPGGNGCIDACECEGDFEPDGDVDGTDAVAFKNDFFRKDCS
ncbi:MAG: hypothetical protein KAR43_04390, partial [Deltaproteobacteria bacterium]|nr:hypothetical protein [Deltaproteobacteria bacterium]